MTPALSDVVDPAYITELRICSPSNIYFRISLDPTKCVMTCFKTCKGSWIIVTIKRNQEPATRSWTRFKISATTLPSGMRLKASDVEKAPATVSSQTIQGKLEKEQEKVEKKQK